MFMLEVSDNSGADASDRVAITVSPVNTAPVADAGQNQSIPEQTEVILTGGATDSDGDIVSYLWRQTSGIVVNLENSDQINANFVAPTVFSPLTLSFNLLVMDNEGASHSDTVTITVEPVNVPPSVYAGADQWVDEDTTVSFSVLAFDEDGDSYSLLWEQMEGPQVELSSINDGAAASFIAPKVAEPVTLAFRLTANDGNGGISSDRVEVTVNPVFELHNVFPPIDTAYFGDDIDVTGRIDNYEGELSSVVVVVNSSGTAYPATIDETGFWRVQNVPLVSEEGAASLHVTAKDALNNTDSYIIEFDTQPNIIQPKGLIYNRYSGELYSYSYLQLAVVAIDVESGVRRVLSSENVGLGRPLPWVQDMAAYIDGVDESNSKIYLLTTSSIIEVDVSTGDRRWLPYNFASGEQISLSADGQTIYLATRESIIGLSVSENTTVSIASQTTGVGPQFGYIESLDYDASTHSLYAADSDLEALINVNLTSLERAVVSDSSVGSGPNDFRRYGFDSELDDDNRRIIFSSSNMTQMFSVDLDSGDREVLLDDLQYPLPYTRPADAIAYDDQTAKFYGIYKRQFVASFDEQSSSVDLISSSFVGAGATFVGASDVQYNERDNELILTNYASVVREPITLIDLADSTRRVQGRGIRNQILDARFIMEDNSLIFRSVNGIYRYDMMTDVQADISTASRGDGPLFSTSVHDIVLDRDSNRFYVLSNEDNEIYAVDIETGDRSLVFSEPSDADSSILPLRSLMYSSENQRLYSFAGARSADLFSFDTPDWEKQLDASSLSGGIPIAAYWDDSQGNVYTLYSASSHSPNPWLQKINVETFETSIISSGSRGGGHKFDFRSAFTVDPNNERAFVVEYNRVFSVDIVSGDRAVLVQ